MKRLPRVPVWLILVPLAALALAAWFGPAAAQSYTTTRAAYAAAPPPGPSATPTAGAAASPTPSAQSSHACPPPGQSAQSEREWHDTPWGGLWFDLAGLEDNAMQDCARHGHGPPPWSHGHGGPPPWSHGHHGGWFHH
jgi:hypothetical protein